MFLMDATQAIGAFLLSVGIAVAADTTKPAAVKEFAFTDLAGSRHTMAEWRDRKAVVMIFLGTECPVSNGYAQTMIRLAESFAPKGVAFYGIYSDPDVDAAAAKKHAEEFKLATVAKQMPLMLDHPQVLASQVGATRMPEAVVLLPTGQVMYRGRIDDRHSMDGRRREEPKVKDLEKAIEAILAGKTPEPFETKVFGCPLPPPAKPTP